MSEHKASFSQLEKIREKNMARFPRVPGDVKLDFGGYKGQNPGFLSANIDQPCDIEMDMDVFPYPFTDNYADSIVLTSVLQHLKEPTKVMQELYRISRDKAKIFVTVPYHKFHTILFNPYHTHDFHPKWFYNLGHRIHNRDDNSLIKTNFKVIDQWFMRGRIRPWKKYHTYTILEAQK